MVRAALLVAAAVALLAAVALALVPFDARLTAEARDGAPLDHTVALGCRAPVLDGLGLDPVGEGGAPEPCVERARLRLGAGLATAVTGTGLLVTGLRRPLAAVDVQPSRR